MIINYQIKIPHFFTLNEHSTFYGLLILLFLQLTAIEEKSQYTFYTVCNI